MYNDFYVGAGADVTVVAGCGVHTDNDGMAKHNGIHRFFLDRGAHVLYQEKHIGTGTGTGFRRIDPVTDIELGEDAVLEMDTIQIGGVDSTFRKTTAKLGARARLIIHERLMTDGEDTAVSDFDCDAGGRGFRCGSDFPVCCQRKFPPGLPFQDQRQLPLHRSFRVRRPFWRKTGRSMRLRSFSPEISTLH